MYATIVTVSMHHTVYVYVNSVNRALAPRLLHCAQLCAQPFPLNSSTGRSIRTITTAKAWGACMKGNHYRIQLHMRGHVCNMVRRHVRDASSRAKTTKQLTIHFAKPLHGHVRNLVRSASRASGHARPGASPCARRFPREGIGYQTLNLLNG